MLAYGCRQLQEQQVREQLLREHQLRQQAQVQLPAGPGLGQGPTNVAELERHLLAQQYSAQVGSRSSAGKASGVHA